MERGDRGRGFLAGRSPWEVPRPGLAEGLTEESSCKHAIIVMWIKQDIHNKIGIKRTSVHGIQNWRSRSSIILLSWNLGLLFSLCSVDITIEFLIYIVMSNIFQQSPASRTLETFWVDDGLVHAAHHTPETT